MAATTTQTDDRKTGEGDSRNTVSRSGGGDSGDNGSGPSPVEKLRDRWPWFDHLMHMNERYGDQGGNHYAAGITYFSVLSLFPLLMVVFATIATVLAGNGDLLDDIIDRIRNSVSGSLGDTLTDILNQAISQRGSLFSIGIVLSLWTGLGWIGNLRAGISSVWKAPLNADNFLKGKISDLVGLVGLLLALVIAFAVTAVGSGGFTWRIIEVLNLEHVTGIRVVVWFIALLIALVANWVVMFWMLAFFPRVHVPRKAAARGAVIGAVALEIFKQFATVFFNTTMSNPAGAAFGPVIGVMVLMYLLWRITLYCSAWIATTPEALAEEVPDAPEPAVIEVRARAVRQQGEEDAVRRAGLVGVGAVAGVLLGGTVVKVGRFLAGLSRRK